MSKRFTVTWSSFKISILIKSGSAFQKKYKVIRKPNQSIRFINTSIRWKRWPRIHSTWQIKLHVEHMSNKSPAHPNCKLLYNFRTILWVTPAQHQKDFWRTYDHDIAQAGKYLEIFSADPGDAHRPPGQVCSMIFSSILTNQCIVTPKTV